jgi:N-acylglucosamine 2-epimerase
MILIVTAQVLREADPENAAKYTKWINHMTGVILTDFLKPEKKALFETVGSNGELLDTPAGRLVNPGHAIETSWFLLTEAMRNQDKELIQKSLDIMNWSYDLGWDPQYGGLLSFIDIDGRPSEKLEWDMKMWWPISETLVAYLMAYKATGDIFYLDRFKLVNEYFFSHFRDVECGEWYGYLHRDGTVSSDLKGNMFKGPFHIPRALMICYLMLDEMC